MTKTNPLAGIRAAFICGCGHSGTTLLATMLSMHPKVHVPLYESCVFLGDEDTAAEGLVKLREETLAAGKSYLIEKTPRHVRQLRRLRRHTVRPRLILMVRDGRDVTASIGNRHGGDLEAGLKRWVDDNAHVIRQMQRRDVFLLRYEDFIANPKRQLKAICHFLGLPYDPAMLDYHKRPALWFNKTEVTRTSGVGSDHDDLRNWQVNQPLFDGRGRWKTDLPAEMLARFETGEALETMRAFGYPTERWRLPPFGGWSGPGGTNMDRVRLALSRVKSGLARRLRLVARQKA